MGYSHTFFWKIICYYYASGTCHLAKPSAWPWLYTLHLSILNSIHVYYVGIPIIMHWIITMFYSYNHKVQYIIFACISKYPHKLQWSSDISYDNVHPTTASFASYEWLLLYRFITYSDSLAVSSYKIYTLMNYHRNIDLHQIWLSLANMDVQYI